MSSYLNTSISFTIENVSFHASNFSFAPLTNPMPQHSHGPASYEIHYVPSGYGTLKLRDASCQIIPNTLYITGPHVEHSQIPHRENPMTEYCIYLQAVSQKKNKSATGFLLPFLSTPFWFGQDNQKLHLLFQQIFLELEHQKTGYLAEVEALLRQMVIRLVRNYEIKKETSHPIDSRPFASHTPNTPLVMEECFLYDYQTITLESLASRLGLSPRQTERLLKKQYGQTFLQKRTQARMAAASTMLLDTGLPITSIAEKLGYSSAEHFSTAFRRFYGISARSYRNQLK